MSLIREVLSRKINFESPKGKVVLKKDLAALIDYLNNLTMYPWTPKQCMNIKKSTDLEFIARSPELVEYLIGIIFQLLNEEEPTNDRHASY